MRTAATYRQLRVRAFSATHVIASTVLLLLAVVIMAMGTTAPAYADEPDQGGSGQDEATIQVVQHYTANATGARNTFSYVMEAVTPNAPMPTGSKDGVYTWTMKGNASATIAIPYSMPVPDGCEYRVYQQKTDVEEGFELDKTVYTLKLMSTRTEAGSSAAVIIAFDEKGAKPTEVGWNVKYTAPKEEDKKTPSSTTSKTSSSSSPKTGDMVPFALLGMAAVLSLATVFVAAAGMRRRSGVYEQNGASEGRDRL